MAIIYLLLAVLGFGAIALGMNIVEEVYRIAVILTGGMLLVTAFILAPAEVQIGVGFIVLIVLQRLNAEQVR